LNKKVLGQAKFDRTLCRPTSTSVPESRDLSFSVTPTKLIQDIKISGIHLILWIEGNKHGH